MPNIELEPKERGSIFRKFATAGWDSAFDAAMYGSHDIVVDKALAFIDDYRERTGKHLTMTHLVTKGMAMAFQGMPDGNTALKGSKLLRRKNITLSLVVMRPWKEGKADLSFATLFDVDKKSLDDILAEADPEIERVRRNRGSRVGRSRAVLARFPVPLLRWSLKGITFLTHRLNLDLSKLGVPKDMFGTAIISNVGGLGLRTAYSPMIPYSYAPIVVTIGTVEKTPVVENDKVVVRQVLRLNVTVDHRHMDAYHASKMTHALSDYLADPAAHAGAVVPLAAGARK